MGNFPIRWTKAGRLAFKYVSGDPEAKKKVARMGGIDKVVKRHTEQEWQAMFDETAMIEIKRIIKENG